MLDHQADQFIVARFFPATNFLYASSLVRIASIGFRPALRSNLQRIGGERLFGVVHRLKLDAFAVRSS